MRNKKEIHRCFDEYGMLRVLDDGNKRYLSFASEDEQSCCLKTDPTHVQHEYSRAMLLVLLFCQPRRVLTLGLGAGVLNHCLHRHCPGLKQEIIELRQEVIDAAYRYFQFPRHRHIHVHCQEANTYLQTVPGKQVDILFTDLYTDQGLDEQQLQPDFIHACHARLKPNGWLVMNCWRDHRQHQQPLLAVLQHYFSDIRACTTQSGNWVILAGRQTHLASQRELKRQAKHLSQQLNCAMLPLLNRLETLQRPE